MRRISWLLLLLGVAVAVAYARQATERGAAPGQAPVATILVSFDGWRWDYETRTPAPNLRQLAARGVEAEGLVPAFPSKTFPNHYSIVTGLYPGHHGIVANNIKDPVTGRTFAMSKPEEVQDPMWWGGEPIWVTAERRGLATASMFWVGSEAPIEGVLPRYWKAYDARLPPTQRVDQVLQWLDLPAPARPSFITLYFSDVDGAGHDDGPDAPAVREAVSRSDGYLGRLLRGLDQRRLTDRVNVVVVSDHGMAAVDASRVVVLDDYVAAADVDVVDLNPTLGIFPRAGRDEAVFKALSGAHPRLKVYRRETTPASWHYRDHPRIPPIVGVADEGWQVLRRNTIAGILAGKMSGARGMHGYDPAVLSMHGIFVAAGPSFRRGVRVPRFENVHIYNALAEAIGVTPAPNDGDPAVARSLLR